MEDKLTEIEISIAHQDNKIDELSDIVHKQWHEIDLLKKKLQFANDKIVELESFIDDNNTDTRSSIDRLEEDKPPHY